MRTATSPFPSQVSLCAKETPFKMGEVVWGSIRPPLPRPDCWIVSRRERSTTLDSLPRHRDGPPTGNAKHWSYASRSIRLATNNPFPFGIGGGLSWYEGRRPGRRSVPECKVQADNPFPFVDRVGLSLYEGRYALAQIKAGDCLWLEWETQRIMWSSCGKVSGPFLTVSMWSPKVCLSPLRGSLPAANRDATVVLLSGPRPGNRLFGAGLVEPRCRHYWSA